MKFLRYLTSPFTNVDSRQSSHGDSVAALDGIRGLPVLIVLTSHTAAFGRSGNGGIGVFLFFALSGFVLMLPFADRPQRIFQPREVLELLCKPRASDRPGLCRGRAFDRVANKQAVELGLAQPQFS
jgi:hypothetical protein